MSELVQYERVGSVGIVTLTGRGRFNVLGTPFFQELTTLSAKLRADAEMRCTVLTGSAAAFSAGADIQEISGMTSQEEFRQFISRFIRSLQEWRSLGVPSIAAIEGIAAGGGLELALSCDLRVAASDATLSLPEVKLGLLPAATGTQRVASCLPPAVAKEMLITGEPLDPQRAWELGLLNKVTPPGQALEAAMALALQITKRPAEAVSAALRLVDELGPVSFEARVMVETEAVTALFATPDRAEGIQAFFEKREPSF